MAFSVDLILLYAPESPAAVDAAGHGSGLGLGAGTVLARTADPPRRPIVPMRRVPWGAMTVFWVVVLYGFVNVEVSRAYAAATGRHAPPVKQADRREAPAG